jgi:hypothetical protein
MRAGLNTPVSAAYGYSLERVLCAGDVCIPKSNRKKKLDPVQVSTWPTAPFLAGAKNLSATGG